MLIALVRHGQTDWNLGLRMQGRTDVPLNETGRAQARAGVAGLAALGEWDVVVSSTLGRARETAELLASGLGLPIGAAYADLVEQEFGDAEGLLVADARTRWPDRAGIPNLEPDAEVGPRARRALEQIRAAHPGGRVIAVAHGTLIRNALAELSGLSADDYPKLDNVSSSLVRADESGWSVLTAGGVPFDELFAGAEGRVA